MLGAMIVMPGLDVSINMLTLFAFILVLGIVVDDAIIVGENIYAHQQMGSSWSKASYEGTVEVGRPVIFSVLTTVAAFAPLLFVGGMMGKFMWPLPVIVMAVLVASLVESLYILPAHLNRDRRENNARGLHRVFGRLLQWAIRAPYQRTLDWALRHRYIALSIALGSLMLTIGLFAGRHLKMIFMPELEGDVVTAQLRMPFGTPADVTGRHMKRMLRTARETVAQFDAELPPGTNPDNTILRDIYAQQGNAFGRFGGPRRSSLSGGSGGHIADVAVFLKEEGQRNTSATGFANAWRKRIGEIAGAESMEFRSTIMHMGSPIDIQLAHDDFAVLQAAADRVKAALANYTGLFDIADSYEEGKRELKLRLRPEARALGIQQQDLARQVRGALYGAEALRLQRERNELKVMVRYPLDQRRSLADVDSMRIRTPSGGEIPFGQAAYIDEGRGYSEIKRVDRRRVINVTARANLKVANPEEIVAELKRSLLPQLMADYPGMSYDLEGQQRHRRETMRDLMFGLLAALLLIYALLAVPSKSYAQPLIIMSAIPFGLIGAVIGHLLLGYDMSMMSFFGVVALAGVVVNDSLVMVDFINRNRAKAPSLREAVIAAGKRRFRPIILTTLTTFFALVPMLAETSVQARFLVPMAISLAFGVVGATLITLVLVPTLYMILDDAKRGLSRAWAWTTGRPAPRQSAQTDAAPQAEA
jgi:multidrug efflux pump subunit AcrB